MTGELGAFLGYRSPFSAVVTQKGLIYKLSTDQRERLVKENFELAFDFQRLAIIMLGNQLMKTSSTLTPASA